MSLREAIEVSQELFIQQRKEWTEIVVDFETRNRYAVMDTSGTSIGLVAEVSSGVSGFFSRWFFGSHRPLDVHILEIDGAEILHLKRSFFWFFSSLDVVEVSGVKVGCIVRRFGILYRKYDLLDEFGKCFARIVAPHWRIWTFPIEGKDGVSKAQISKK